MRNFEEWLKQLRKCISDYGYYVNFEKVYENVGKINVELNILNSLIGSKDIEHDLRLLLKEYPKVIKCIPILLAVRSKSNEIYVQDSEGAFTFNFSKLNYSIDQYIMFMRKTGLLELISNRLIKSLVDYVMGVETGLDSNGRKNRGGKLMENLVEGYIAKTVVPYYKQMMLSTVEKKWNVNLSAISSEGTTEKQWDFVVKGSSTIYLIETNFYTGGGSKLNETARSYKMIAEEAKSIDGIEFVWITDGSGWKSAKKNLEETYKTMKNLYNISELEKGILHKVFR